MESWWVWQRDTLFYLFSDQQTALSSQLQEASGFQLLGRLKLEAWNWKRTAVS
jgi:hypothetical protein